MFNDDFDLQLYTSKEYELEQEKFMNEIIEIEVSESDKTYKLKIKRSEIIKMINFSELLD